MNNMKQQPIKGDDGADLCPNDREELHGDGENGLFCPECDYKIHESEVK